MSPQLSDREFSAFQALIHEVAGIWLGDNKRALVVGRLARRLRELELPSFAAYHRLALQDPAEMVRMLDAITTNETHFFREPAQFELLADRLCPQWEREAAAGQRARRLRIWSAACSSGEEPYSLGMLLHDRLGRSGWAIDILASDLSTKVLGRAKEAVWPVEKTAGIPAPYLRRYMLRGMGPEEGRVKVGCEIRDLVRFTRLNLQDEHYAVHGTFDAVFCRNVLIYFDAPSRQRVIARLMSHIVPGGYLFLGHAESLMGMSSRARSLRPAVYQVLGEAVAA